MPSQEVARPKKKTKTVLDQREAFKVRPQRCFAGYDQPQVHHSNNAVAWETAISRLADLGIDMSGHFESPQEAHTPDEPYRHTTITYEGEDPSARFCQQPETLHSRLARDIPQRQSHTANGAKDDNLNFRQLQTDFYGSQRANAEGQNSARKGTQRPLGRHQEEDVSAESISELKKDMLESLTYAKSPSGNPAWQQRNQ